MTHAPSSCTIGSEPAALADSSYDAKVERAVIVHVEAFDWNCPQHITPRFTAAEIEPMACAIPISPG